MFKFDLQDNEKVVSIYRQSEAVLFRPVILIFVLIYFPWYFLIKYELAATYPRLLIFWTLLVFLYAVNKYILWLLNVYLLTDKRLVRVKHLTVFNKQVIETPLTGILSVSFHVKGFWQSLFQFGSVEAQTIGLPEPLSLQNVAHPSQIKDYIWQAKERYSPTIIPSQQPEFLRIKKSPVVKKKIVI